MNSVKLTEEQNKILLSVSDLYAYYDETEVLSGVSLDLRKGEIVCIVGESGSGKSTLIKAICGMPPLKITGGSIAFDGREITRISGKERQAVMGSGIGLIPQNPGASFNPIRKFSLQFREALEAHGHDYDEEVIIRAFEATGLTGGSEILSSRPYEMSGGMNQRIAIAAAMILDPEVLLCDEATSALDVTTAGVIVNELMDLRRERDTAILMVTHHLGIAQRMADRIGIMKKGRIIEEGPVEQIFEAPREEYTKQLIADVPRLKK